MNVCAIFKTCCSSKHFKILCEDDREEAGVGCGKVRKSISGKNLKQIPFPLKFPHFGGSGNSKAVHGSVCMRANLEAGWARGHWRGQSGLSRRAQAENYSQLLSDDDETSR